jgi:hypothetical protein
VGNIHVNVTEKLLAEVFQTAGPLAGCKLIRKDKVEFSTQVFLASSRNHYLVILLALL